MTNYKRVTNVNGQDRLFFDKRKGMPKNRSVCKNAVRAPTYRLLTSENAIE